jgi:hypothetical protein
MLHGDEPEESTLNTGDLNAPHIYQKFESDMLILLYIRHTSAAVVIAGIRATDLHLTTHQRTVKSCPCA